MIRAVLFDLDGTLYNYDECNDAAENELFRCLQEFCRTDRKEVQKLLSRSKKNVKARLLNTAASHNRLLYMQELCEICEINPLIFALKLYDIYWNEFLKNMKPYPFVYPLLEYLSHHKIKIGILTDLTAQIQYRKIHTLGIADWIDNITTSEEVGIEKPSIEMFCRARQKMKVAYSEILMIGDDYLKDIEGAKNAGMKYFLFENQEKIHDQIITLCMEAGV